MGSMISLSVGKINIDWGKNEFFLDHGHLFQDGDYGSNEYDYVKEDGSPLVEVREALRRPLSRVVPRLELMGYTITGCAVRLKLWLEEDFGSPVDPLDTFRQALRSFDWRNPKEYVDFEEEFREAYAKALGEYYTEDSSARYIGWEKTIDPYLVIRLLADMPEYADIPVCWNYADVKEGEYVDASTFTPHPPGRRWMIVTEGGSDVLVLSRSLKVTHPDIADFFDFIDMNEGNPFPGVGSIVSFCKGLSRIRYDGNMLVVLDNDSAGRAALSEIKAFRMPSTFVVTCLPDLEELKEFKTIGPAGENVEDINGRASAIECFLDFRGVAQEPTVRWTTFMSRQSTYQGELVNKGDYVTHFKTRFGRPNVVYDTSKLVKLWEHLIRSCVAANQMSANPMDSLK